MGAPPYAAGPFSDKLSAGRVTLMESPHDGYGDAQRANLQYIFPRRNRRPYSYNRAIGTAECRWAGEFGPGLALSAFALVTGQSMTGPPFFADVWEDAVPNPLVIFVYATGPAAGGKINTLQSGIIGAGNALTTTPTGADLHDDGSGVPYLYVAEDALSGGTNKVQKRDRAGTVTTCTNLVANKLLSLNNDLYLSATPTGGTAICGIGKVAAGTNPSTAAQPALTVVGFAGSSINAIAADGSGKFPVALKPEGVFVYDRALDLWLNRGGRSWVQHPDNGKAFWYEDTDLIIGLGQGGAVRFNGVDTVPYDPIPMYGQPNNDTTGQQISAGGNTRHWGALVTKMGSKHQRTGGVGGNTAQIDFAVTVNSGSSYVDYSSSVSDGTPTTSADLSALGTDATSWFVVGSPNPFNGVYFDMLNVNGSASWPMVVDIWTGSQWINIPTRVDMTQVATGGLGRSAWCLLYVDPITLGWANSALINLAKSRYWMRFRATSGTMTNPTKVRGVELLPYRPSVDVANFPSDGSDRSGVWPHLLFSRVSEDGEHVTHDFGMLASPDEIGAVVYGPAGGAGLNDDRALVMFGRQYIHYAIIALDDRVAMTSWPIFGANGGVELPTKDLDMNVTIKEFGLEGVEWNATGYLYYRFEDGRPWSLAGTFTNLPVRIPINELRGGRYLKTMVAWKLTAAQQRQVGRPRITRIDCVPVPSTEQFGALPVQSPVVV